VNAKYLKPVKLQKELDALNQKLTAAQQRVTEAQTQVSELESMVNNPSACNVTGSAVIPMTPAQAEAILIGVDRKGGTR
jgi:cytochrome c oxidase assembly protein Cox11